MSIAIDGASDEPHSRAPSAAERRGFVLVALGYCALALVLWPWATAPGMQEPRLIAVTGSAILVADLCTALLLGASYRATGRAPLLALACGYLGSGVMAGLHMSTFPGALFPKPLFGTEQTVGWLYSAWRGGAVLAYLAAVLLEARGAATAPLESRTPNLTRAVLAVLAACALSAALAAGVSARSMSGEAFTATNRELIWLWVGVCAAALAILCARRAFHQSFYLWLAWVLVASMVDLTFGNIGGRRYTLGWHVSRASFVVSTYLLLAFLVSGLSTGPRSRLSSIAEYGAAVAATLAAVFLRWFLDPWLGHDLPFITLFGAVAVSVWLGGLGPAVAAAVLGFVLLRSVYIGPAGTVWLSPGGDIIARVLFVLTNALIIGLGAAMRRARDAARQSEASLRERAAELMRADAHKSQFLAMLAHELRNPLAPIQTGVSIVKMRPDAAIVDRTLGMMERQIHHLTRLIDDLLDVSRISRDKLELKRSSVALASVVQHAVETWRPICERAEQTLVVELPSEPIHVHGDPARLAQMLGNLLGNACKYSERGGRISLTVVPRGREVTITVQDGGGGIAPDVLPRIFDLFVQGDQSLEKTTGGLGIGLSLVKRLVELHGGSVSAASDGPGRGATFQIRLPIVDPETTFRTAPPREEPSSAPARRILVVDDNRDSAVSLAALLQMAGHSTETAYDGVGAIDQAARFRPDVVVLDIGLPGLNGYEVCRRLRAEPWARSALIVAMTGWGQDGDRRRSTEAGFDHHLVKPLDPDTLLTLLATWSPSGDEGVVAAPAGASTSTATS